MIKAAKQNKMEKEQAMTRIKVMVTNYLSSFSNPRDLDGVLKLRSVKA